jgi:hypothetical protein
MLAGSYYPAEFTTWPPLRYWLMGAATAIMLFAGVLLKEPSERTKCRYQRTPSILSISSSWKTG